MSDRRKYTGGARKGAGRKPKEDEIAAIEMVEIKKDTNHMNPYSSNPF